MTSSGSRAGSVLVAASFGAGLAAVAAFSGAFGVGGAAAVFSGVFGAGGVAAAFSATFAGGSALPVTVGFGARGLAEKRSLIRLSLVCAAAFPLSSCSALS